MFYVLKLDQKWKPLLILGGFATIKNDEVTVLVSGIEEVVKENYEEAKIFYVKQLKIYL